MRAAVTTGEAVVALGARPERGEGIVAGDVVNTAARLQSAASPGTVIVDETTMRSSDAAIAFEPLAPVEAKGKSEPIATWRAVEARSRVGEAEMATRTPFVGREHERAVLLESFLRVERESAVQLVTIVGEPGIGKSRLVAELRTSLDDRPELVTWRHGRCLPYGEGITFWALGEAVKAEAGILESDDQAEAAAKLEQAVSALFEDDSEREWLASRLGPLVGAGGEAGAVGRDEAFTSWRRFLEAMAARRPVVLVVEDLHWADTALLDFLEHVLDWGAPVPLLVLATTRPELYDRRAGWGGGRRNATTISLSPLSAEETARLLQGLLERAVLPAETQAALLEKAGGNPLYTEQFASMLSERGDGGSLAVPGDGAGAHRRPAGHALARAQGAAPGRVRRREELLDGSGRGARRARRTTRCSRASASSCAGSSCARRVSRRSRARRSSRSGTPSCATSATRRFRGRRGARSTRRRRPGSRSRRRSACADHAEIIVHHYEQALALSQAAGDERPDLEEALARFLLLAGDNAMRLDVGAAETAYRRALELSEDASARGAVLGRLGDALQEQGRLPESEQVYEEAISALPRRRRRARRRGRRGRVGTGALAARADGARPRGDGGGGRGPRARARA